MSGQYLTTRVRLFRPRLWSAAELSGLIEADDAALPELLQGRGLAPLSEGYKAGDGRSLEARIVAHLLDETRILLRPLAGAGRQFLLYWIERFEVSNVKTLIRAKMAGERPAAAAAHLLDLGPFARLDAEGLLHAEDVHELLRRLEASPYAEIVRHARQSFDEHRDPFLLDATLDRAYYEGLVRRARALEASEGRQFARLVGHLVDAVNLVWLLRYRFNYALPPAQVYYLLVASHYRLHAAMLRSLVTQTSPQAVIAQLPEALARLLDGCTGVAEAATRMEHATRREAGRVLAVSGATVARVLAYLILREANLRSVRAVLRGRHIGLGAVAIRQAIGGADGEFV